MSPRSENRAMSSVGMKTAWLSLKKEILLALLPIKIKKGERKKQIHIYGVSTVRGRLAHHTACSGCYYNNSDENVSGNGCHH